MTTLSPSPRKLVSTLIMLWRGLTPLLLLKVVLELVITTTLLLLLLFLLPSQVGNKPTTDFCVANKRGRLTLKVLLGMKPTPPPLALLSALLLSTNFGNHTFTTRPTNPPPLPMVFSKLLLVLLFTLSTLPLSLSVFLCLRVCL